MRLRTLVAGLAELPEGAGETAISGLSPDSRAVKPGYLFAALPGTAADGAAFVPAAVKSGAVAILASADSVVADTGGVPVLRVANPRRVLALMAARFHIGQPETIVAVTGTNGKTSVASFVRQIWAGLGQRAASLGTIGLIRPSGDVVETLTTPEPVTLHALLAELTLDNVTHLSLEASSHGLEQHRLDGVKLAAGGFTNITRDHLDYHKDFEDYFAQKMRLFSDLLPAGAAAVINADAERSGEVIDRAYQRSLKVMTVGLGGRSIKLVGSQRDGFAQVLSLRHDGETYEVRLPLVGDFQASNALVAAGLAIASGSSPDGVFARLEHLQGATGRLDLAGATAAGAPVFIDYAHTPDALEKALRALRPYATRRLVVVFGCGGDRDRGKRPQMGRVAAAEADHAIVTDDNPRSEAAEAIRAEILAGIPSAHEIGDRALAIATAIDDLKAGDVLLVAGKGHETGQMIGKEKRPFSDHEAVRAALAGQAYGTQHA